MAWNVASMWFQSTHPRGVRHGRRTQSSSRFTCFNPRTREGCDTIAHGQQRGMLVVSIHAPARGATRLMWKPLRLKNRFQSTLPRGVRPIQRLDGGQHSRVSIHAPARGATSVRASAMPRACASFNPRTREGCDSPAAISLSAMVAFQSTHPRGVRPAPRCPPHTAAPCFNPRTREGCDTTHCV